MRDSRQARRTVEAHAKGYRVLGDGTVTGPLGAVLSLVLRPWRNGKKSYLSFNVKLPGDGYSRRVMVHQLAAFQKFGTAALESGVGARHLDDDPLNNALDNIGIGTQSQNMMDRAPEERLEHAKVAARSRRKLSLEQVAELRKDRADGCNYAFLAAKYGISKATISSIVSGNTYKDCS